MRQTSSDRDRLLGIYLDDHRAGAAGGVALARRMLEANPHNCLTSTLRELTDEIDEDRARLDDVIRRLGHTPNRLKIIMSAVGEKFARLKPNGRFGHYSPLSRLEEFEMLSSGIMAKESLWQCCELTLTGRPEVADVDFVALRERAAGQRARLESHRARIVDDAFGLASGGYRDVGVAEQR
jgi:hypothetical protein